MPTERKAITKKSIKTGYYIIVLIMISPLIAVVLAELLGLCLGCEVNEAGTSDCLRMGVNFGAVLSTLFIMGWAVFITFPIGLVLIAAWSFYVKKRTHK